MADRPSEIFNTQSTSQQGKNRGYFEETIGSSHSGNGPKIVKKISFDAPFYCDSEYHNLNLIEICERVEKNCFVGQPL